VDGSKPPESWWPLQPRKHSPL